MKHVISFLYFELFQFYESVTINTVVSNLGGQLGLWLGASVISLIHLCTCLPFCLATCMKSKTKRPNIVNSSPVKAFSTNDH